MSEHRSMPQRSGRDLESGRPVVGIVMGSDSDWPVMSAAADALDEFGIPYEVDVVSAHRMPTEMIDYGRSAAERGLPWSSPGPGERRTCPACSPRSPAAGHRGAGAAGPPRRDGLAALDRPDARRRAGGDRVGRRGPQRRAARRADPRAGWAGGRPGARRDGALPGAAARPGPRQGCSAARLARLFARLSPSQRYACSKLGERPLHLGAGVHNDREPAASARAAAGSSTTPSCSHRVRIPSRSRWAIASSTTAPTSWERTKKSTTSTTVPSGMSPSTAYPCCPQDRRRIRVHRHDPHIELRDKEVRDPVGRAAPILRQPDDRPGRGRGQRLADDGGIVAMSGRAGVAGHGPVSHDTRSGRCNDGLESTPSGARSNDHEVRCLRPAGLADGPGRHRPEPALGRHGRSRSALRRGRGLGVALGLRPLPHRAQALGRGDPRGVVAHGGVRGVDDPHPARSDVHLHGLSQPCLPRQGRRNHRHHLRRAGRDGNRSRLVRTRVARLRIRLPGGARPARCAARRRRDLPPDVDPGQRPRMPARTTPSTAPSARRAPCKGPLSTGRRRTAYRCGWPGAARR
jgi:hypothetical protein